MKRTSLLLFAAHAIAAPLSNDQPDSFTPGESELYNTYRGKAPPFPGNLTQPIFPTSTNAPAPDDRVWQNLLAAEWIVYSFYQQGVEKFNASSFTDAGFPNTTYDRLTEIRDNEAGHMAIFYDEISDAVIKPGPCKYQYPFTTATDYLTLQLVIEVSSMAFTTGLAEESKLRSSVGAINAVGQTETRHTTWALMDIWGQNPFGGPVDTVYPYAEQVLSLTSQFVVRGSCPEANPPYPFPDQDLPLLAFNATASKGLPGDDIQFTFTNPVTGGAARPDFQAGKDYYAVFFHGVENVTVPYDPVKSTSKIPDFEVGKGVIMAVIADTPGAPTAGSVISGPLIMVEQPAALAVLGAP